MKLFEIEGQLSLFDESLFSVKMVVPVRKIKTFAAWETDDGDIYVAIDDNNTLIVKSYDYSEEKKCPSLYVAEALFNDLKDKLIIAACIRAIEGKKTFRKLDFCPLSA